ncbi:MAG: nucleoside triphosphate pyrophosphatase [Deltaproteobacteria bacterium]
MSRVLLASTSRYRHELVSRLGLDVACLSPPYDEEEAKRALGPVTPEALVVELARGKAASLAAHHPGAVVIGADQVAVIDGEVLGKPGTLERACAQLERLAGREHRLLTGIAVASGGRVETALDVHTLRMRPLSRAAIEDYVRRDAPLDCAGAYRVEALGIALFESLRGEDFTAIIGLPLTRVVTLLARFGIAPLAG